MSIQIKVYIEDHEFNASFFQHGIIQNSDFRGQPTSIPEQAGIHLTVPMIKESLFEEWGYATCMMKYMEIHIIPIVPGQEKTRILRCYDSILVNFYADYKADRNKPANFHLRIICGGIEPSWSSAMFNAYWRSTYPVKEEPVAVIQEIKEPKLVKGWWSADPNGCNLISNANLGDTVYFHVNTEDIEAGEQVKCRLWEYDHFFGLDQLNVDEDKFPNHHVNFAPTVQELNGAMTATARVKLQEKWGSMITDDNGDQLELYCNVGYKELERELPASRRDVLYVGHSKRTLYFRTPVATSNLPEFMSYNGDPLFLVKFAYSFEGRKTRDALGRLANNATRRIAFAKLEKGNMVDNRGKVYEGDRLIFEYKKVYANSGELFENVKKGKNFGFELPDGLHTTKGISQYDYFSKNGKRVTLLGMAKDLGHAFDIFNLTKDVGKELDLSAPIPLDLGPLTPILDLAGILVKQQKAEMDTALALEIQKEIDHAKLQGLDTTRKAISSWNHNQEYNWQLIAISNETANKLLQGEFKTFEELEDYDFDQKIRTSEIKIHILCRITEDIDKEQKIYLIETMFIDE